MTLYMHRRRARRRWGALAVGVAILATLLGGTALAVHNTGIFQMDGDAQTSLDSTPTALEDWDLICKANPDTCTFQAGYTVPAGTTTATVSSHESDGVAQSIFTGGGSKDGQDIPNWKWKNGSVPDKDELLHAFAARYSTTPSATCPVTAGQTTCELLYFGSDRFDNSGDATQAFWFFQNRITLNANGTFNGVHRDGDLLIISEFSNGGTTSTITVYKWLNGAAVFVAGGPNQKCTPAGATDPFCGIVNPADGTVAPWTYTDKDGNTSYLQGDLYEAGINLSDPSINLGGECFSSFAAESRSSTSLTSVLKDFVLGEFAVCDATITTTPSAGAGGAVLPGASVTDTAVIQGSGLANPPTPTGNVTFFLCGPIATGTCTSGGTQVGSPVALANSAPPPGEASATSAAVNTAGSPLGPGRYCFRAEWPGDTNYQNGPYVHSGIGNSECFLVQDSTSATSAQDWLPNDSATITSAGDTNLNGTVVFTLHASADCTGAAIYTEPTITLTNADSPVTRATTNTTFKVSASTTVSWKTVFTPAAGSNVTGTTKCETTTLTINNNP